MVSSIIVSSPVGDLILSEKDGKIIRIDFGNSEKCGTIRETDTLAECKRQLEEYFRAERREFTLELAPEGTEFQQKVWQALSAIPYGQLRNYGHIAAAIGSPKAARAVGGANHRNPIPIIIPCHRVISADMSLGGYALGSDIKIKLLELEGSAKHIRFRDDK